MFIGYPLCLRGAPPALPAGTQSPFIRYFLVVLCAYKVNPKFFRKINVKEHFNQKANIQKNALLVLLFK